ncbi:8-oxo-dGTP pyrophosphatase MutT (NUDIX family) [Pseudomonas duriflava]|uniref:8-oxo-dGTP pyrophosphatase MutT (NUDIX family) n=1 Tax=Pseudomonas duriflava TaxID=459528 RepID=A0A562Q4K9_9PSED|nr:NUDIX domain-containing protein [Pseudomonas duriflava]TWI50956.1 8-oxo-dGTP pyrophosphatase MutT (NUDIX family) [Pseudomonas duriflava]
MTSVLSIAAACLFNAADELLLVRKRGTHFFMLPGGKQEPGEPLEQTLERELLEELGLRLSSSAYQWLGRFQAPAANEPDTAIDAHLYQVRLPNIAVAVAAELEELVWLPLDQLHSVPLAPLLSQVLPCLNTYGIENEQPGEPNVHALGLPQ